MQADKYLVEGLLQELTYTDILKATDPSFIHHSQHAATVRKMGTRYERTVKDIVQFTTPSETQKGAWRWNQTIKMVDFNDAMAQTDLTMKDKVRLIVAGDLKVHCDCPAFLYWGYDYVLTQLGGSGGNEKRFPGERNPRLKGTVCKHLDAVLRAFPFWIQNIIGDLKRQGFEPEPVQAPEVGATREG